MGDGLTKASAARNPAAFVRSGTSVTLDEIEAVLNLAFRFPGFTVDSSEFPLSSADRAFGTKNAVDPLDGAAAAGERESG